MPQQYDGHSPPVPALVRTESVVRPGERDSGERCRTGMKKLIAALGIVLGVVIAAPGASGAGGWVTVTLDSTPTFVAGDQVDVGFTVLRHGATPETNDDLEVVLTDERGEQHRFDAVPQGVVGHHVATIAVPAAGAYTWSVTGAVVGADLGPLTIGEESSGASTWTWHAVQWGTLAFAAAMGALAGRDALRTRRRPATVPAGA
jgi:hypothetical protein